MHRQLVLLHNATTGFFSGDIDMLERCLKAYHIRLSDTAASLPTAADMKAVLIELPVSQVAGRTASMEAS